MGFLEQRRKARDATARLILMLGLDALEAGAAVPSDGYRVAPVTFDRKKHRTKKRRTPGTTVYPGRPQAAEVAQAEAIATARGLAPEDVWRAAAELGLRRLEAGYTEEEFGVWAERLGVVKTPASVVLDFLARVPPAGGVH